MFSKWSWLRQVVCSLLSIYSFGVSDVLQEPCGYITPESPVVSLESSFTAYCILRDYCSAFGYLRADKVIWRIHTEVVPKKHYSIINGTVSSVTFNDTSILASPLTCNVLITGNIEQTIYGIQVALGLSPDKPENLSCIVHQHKGKKNYSQTCTWEPGRYTFLDTNYTLKSRCDIVEQMLQSEAHLLQTPVKNLTAFPKDGKLWVEWTVPKPDVNRYIIEWYEECDNLTCATDWQLESGTKNCTFLRGGIKPRKSYKISVYPLYSNGQGEERSIQAYLQEDAPAIGPTVRTAKVGKTDALIEWEPLSVEEQNGFIKYYNIIYKTATGNETVVFVDPSKTEYPLSSLSSDTLYMVQVAAYTKNGGKRGPAFTFTTKKFAEGEIEAIVVPVCLAILLFTLLSVLFCFNKRDSIKKHIWPNVPDPSKSVIAQWSPQTPSKHFHHSKDQMYPEGSFTDVSVVEIDKKSFSEQDPKPFYLLRKEKNASEGHSSGIGGSSCMSSPRQSVSDSDEGEPAQNTSSTVQYSTVVPNGYRDQIPSVQVFSRSESTQPLLDSEERPEDPPVLGSDNSTPRHRYFKQNCNNDDTVMDEPHLDGVKQISPINEEDAAGLQTLQMCSSGPDEHDVALAGAFHPSPEGLAAEFETLRTNAVTEDEVPKCYLPQTVKQGGYMPQ
nr:interleukin-6 receptor subunit beta [Zootoca vivipara]